MTTIAQEPSPRRLFAPSAVTTRETPPEPPPDPLGADLLAWLHEPPTWAPLAMTISPAESLSLDAAEDLVRATLEEPSGSHWVEIAVGTGVGKTRLASQHLPHAPRHILMLTPQVALADEAEAIANAEADRAHLPRVTRYEPRRAPDTDDPDVDRLRPGACPTIRIVNELAGQGQIPAATACPGCPPGDAAACSAAIKEGHILKAGQIDADAVVPIQEVTPCGWTPQIAVIQKSLAVIATTASTSSSLTEVIGSGHRDIMTDEPAPPLKEEMVKAEQWEHWVGDATARIGWQKLRLEKELSARFPNDETVDDLRDSLSTLSEAIAVMLEFQALLPVPDPDDTDPHPVPLTAARLEVLGRFSALAQKRLGHGSAAIWEWARVNHRTKKVDAPARRAEALGWSLHQDPKLGTIWMRGRTLHFLCPTQEGRVQIEGLKPARKTKSDKTPRPPRRIVRLNATPSLADRRVAEKRGRLVNAYPDQNVDVEWFTLLSFGRGLHLDKRAKKEAMNLARIREAMWKKTGSVLPPVVLSYMVVILAGRKMGLWSEADSGWWGCHEIGHNLWAGRDMLIVGAPLLPHDALAEQYRADRAWALLNGVDPALFPPCDFTNDDFERGTTVPINGQEWPVSIRLPRDPHVRAWYLDQLRSLMAQAIGRARGLRTKTTPKVWVLAPVIPGLDELGITVTYDRASRPPGHRADLPTTNGARQINAWMRIIETICEAFPDSDTWPSFRKMRALVKLRFKIEPVLRTWNLFLDRFHGLRPSQVLEEVRALARAAAEVAPAEISVLAILECETEHAPRCHCTTKAAGELIAEVVSWIPTAMSSPTAPTHHARAG